LLCSLKFIKRCRMKKLLLITLFTQLTLYSQWVQQTIPVNEPISGIEFVDTLRGWACTGQGSIIHTSNSGTNWQIQLSVPVGFTDIDMLNSLTGYAGGGSKLYWTTDGGTNWNLINMVPNMYIGDMQFLNKDSAWECGVSVGPDVRTTTDGGNTWVVRTNGLNGQTDRIFFLNYNTGFCGASFNLYKTTNAGVNWLLLHSFPYSIQSIFFYNSDTAWVGLSPSGNANVGYTTNGGINWSIQSLQPYGLSITDLYFFNNRVGFTGIGILKIYKTTNAGTNWGYQNVASGSFRFSFVDSTHGWAGNNGICNTTNSGGPISGIIRIGNENPTSFELYQNYPNPFNPVTAIKLDLPKSTSINLVICDMLGRELYQIANEYLRAGSYSFTWDARNFASGIYFYRLTTEDFTETKKMILIK
jgi:Secretion system C-terminal sorting domain